jgi:hypothetical protein
VIISADQNGRHSSKVKRFDAIDIFSSGAFAEEAPRALYFES